MKSNQTNDNIFSKKTTALILMCLLVWFWGLDYVFAKEALTVIQPLNLLFLKYAVGVFLLGAIKFKIDRKALIRKKDIPWLILCSISGEILYNLCEYTAMDYMPVSLITIVLAFVPAFSIITERIIYKRRFTAKIMIGIICCITGVIIVIGADFSVLLQGRLIGYLLAFGAVFAWNLYNFITSKISQNYESITMTFSQLCCTILLIMPYAIHTMPSIDTFTPSVTIGVLYLGIISAGLGFLIQVNGLKVLGPTIPAMFSNFLPVTATLCGWLFLGETIGLMQFVGGGIVIASACVVIIEKGKLNDMNEKDE